MNLIMFSPAEFRRLGFKTPVLQTINKIYAISEIQNSWLKRIRYDETDTQLIRKQARKFPSLFSFM